MSEEKFTRLPSKKRRKTRKSRTKLTLEQELGAVQKEIEQSKDKVQKARTKRRKLKKAEKILETGRGIVSEEELQDLPDIITDEIKKQKVLFEPLVNPVTGRSVQREFLEASEDEVLFAGGRGSGKSQALIVALLRPEYITNRNYRALVIRRTMRELKDLITKAKTIIFDAVPGAKWKTQDNTFYFPSGASIEFGYCENDDDVERYRGREFSILAIDELTMIPTEEMYISLMSSIRNVDPTLPTQVLASTNPYGVGFSWVKKRFVNRGPENTTIVVKHTNDFTGQTYITTRKWLQSNFQDNPLIKDAYIASMASLPEEKRKRWMEGTWDGGDGMAFPEFDRAKHVIKPFAIPTSWPRFRACDWGYSTMAVVLWFAIDPEGSLYCYREFATSHMTADKFAQEVLRLERGERIKYGVIDGSVGDKRGSTAPSIDEEMRKQGCIWRYADKSAGSRMSGKNLIHKYLAIDEALNKPRLQFFETCNEIIEEMSSLPADPDNPDDVDTDAKDHAYDALRFAILSRPKSGPYNSDSPQYKQPPIIFNSTFGY